jgi:hypothetical protein
MSNFN